MKNDCRKLIWQESLGRRVCEIIKDVLSSIDLGSPKSDLFASLFGRLAIIMDFLPSDRTLSSPAIEGAYPLYFEITRFWDAASKFLLFLDLLAKLWQQFLVTCLLWSRWLGVGGSRCIHSSSNQPLNSGCMHFQCYCRARWLTTDQKKKKKKRYRTLI